jgi:hypothetical protein
VPGRRAAARGAPPSRRRAILLWGGLIGLFLAGVVAFAAFGTTPANSPTPGSTNDPGIGDTASGGQGQDVDGIKCEAGEQLVYHVHAHLYILLDGRPQTVSSQVGIPGGPLLAKCIYWLHTHDTSGIIHVESPTKRTFTLGQFFDIWGQPLNRIDVATHPVPSSGLTVFVNGVQYNDDPRNIDLMAHTQVVIELGQVVPPPSFAFPNGV